MNEGMRMNFERRDFVKGVVAIKPTKRQVHVFRCGLGGPACDLEYAYAQGKD